IRFINNSSNISVGTRFIYDYGDGMTEMNNYLGANDTLYHTYVSGLCNGTMSITAYNNCGSSVTTWNPIYVNDRNNAFAQVNTSNCDPAVPFIFTQSSTNNYCLGGGPRRFYWDFGDGTSTGWINSGAAQL